MKVAVIQNYFRPYIIGGAEINVENFIHNLVERKISTLLITSGGNRRCEIISPLPDLKIYRFFPVNLYHNYPVSVPRNKVIKTLWWSLNIWNPFVFQTVRSILKKEKPDIVNIRNFYGLSPSVFTAAKSLKLPILYTVHDFFALCRNSSFFRNKSICQDRCISCSIWGNWNRLFINKIYFHFLSHFSAQNFKKFIPLDNFFILPNPVYLKKDEIRKNIKAKEKKYENNNSLRLLYLGQLKRHKGLVTLLNALKKIRVKNIELWIGGEGELRPMVKDCVQRDKRIKYYGFLSGLDKKEKLLAADVLILPSEWYEVSPLSIQEAYSFGLPVIGTDLGSIPEHIDQQQTGWLFPFQDENSLAHLIEHLSQNKDEVRRQSICSFQKALANTSDIYVERMIEEFKRIADSSNHIRPLGS